MMMTTGQEMTPSKAPQQVVVTAMMAAPPSRAPLEVATLVARAPPVEVIAMLVASKTPVEVIAMLVPSKIPQGAQRCPLSQCKIHHCIMTTDPKRAKQLVLSKAP